jgi:hypothetical protein
MRIIIFGLFMLLFTISYSQVGSRKKEKVHVVHRNIHRQPQTSPWLYRKTKPGLLQDKEMVKLFKWTITKNKRNYRSIQEKQNKLRAKRRVRGKDVFQKRKYF